MSNTQRWQIETTSASQTNARPVIESGVTPPANAILDFCFSFFKPMGYDYVDWKDPLDLYEANSVDDDFIDYGDSITAGSMSHGTAGGVKSLGDFIHRQLPDHFLLEENGGIGYLASDSPIDPRHHYLQSWLHIFPGRYVGLSYGTNDSWGWGDPADIADRVYNTYVVMVQTVFAAGKIPIVPHMIWSPRLDLQICAIAIDGKIEQLYKKYPKVVPGPDLYTVFQNHPADFGDMVHPNDQGIGRYCQAWANMFLRTIYHWEGALR